jgi:hypothetical protein
MGPPALPSKGSPGKGTGKGTGKKAEALRRARQALPSHWAATKLPGGGAERRGGKLMGAYDSRREVRFLCLFSFLSRSLDQQG